MAQSSEQQSGQEAAERGARWADASSPPSRSERALSFGIALLLAAAFLLASIGRSGVWDPHELDRADLARRIAVLLFDATELRVEGMPDAMPTLGDLGMGELPFTSMAWGLSTFGLHDHAGRLPLALWALLGAVVLYLLLARLLSPRAGVYGVIVLVTMPLYFMQARTMLGDIVTMAAHMACFAGMLGALLDDRAPTRARRALTLAGWLSLGVFGGLAGYLSRGIIVGVAAPMLGVGLTWLCLVGAGFRRRGAPGHLAFHGVGGVALVFGVGAIAVGVAALLGLGFGKAPVLRVLGVAMLAKPAAESTFDLTIRDLGHSLFPLSALLPFAFGRLLLQMKRCVGAAEFRELALRVALLIGAACAFGASALLAPYAGALPFAAPGLLAAVVAVVIVDYERGAPPAPVLALGTVLLSIVLWRDLVKIPAKALSVFGVSERTLPKGVEDLSSGLVLAAMAAFAALVFLGWIERGFESQQLRASDWVLNRLRAYRASARSLAELWNGNLLFGLLVVEAALFGLGAMLFVGRRLGWAAVQRFPHNVSLVGLNAWWLLPLVPLVVVLGFDAARGLFSLLLRAARLPRAATTGLAVLVAGGLLCFGYYPALAAQLSPKEVFQRYAELHGQGEPLGVLGLRVRAAEFYAEGERVDSLASARAAHAWLNGSGTAEEPSRRWLVLRASDLPELNSVYRETHRSNVPILDARSGGILLASNELGGADNDNWLEPYLLSEVGEVQHPVTAVFEDKLEALGWDVVGEDGQLVEAVVPQRSYTMRFYFRVLKRISRSYRAFLHIDGYRRRHNGDHDVLRGKYRLSLWKPGDIVVDHYPLVLEPNFTPGEYTVYYGFFQGKSRFEVRSGEHHDNRLDGGRLVVR